MEDIKIQYTLSLYEEISNINENKKSSVILVRNVQNNKIYIKKTLTQYNIETFKVIKKIKSIHIPKIYEILEKDEKLIVIEEFINGFTLKELLDKYKTIEESLVVDYILQLCDAVEEIHNCNPIVIHRDIKPENIMITNDGVLKLIDFDVSRVYKINENRDTEILGTLEYAAPEQFGFRQTDERTDIYSIGILINVLLTGQVPRIEKCKGELQRIVEKCIEIDPKERYNNISMLKSDIKDNCSLKSNEDIDKLDKSDTRNNFIFDVIPGFRTRTLWKMITSVVFYVFIFLGIISCKFEPNKEEAIKTLWTAIILMLLWLLYTDFCNISSELPIINSSNSILKVIGYIGYTLFIIVIISSIVGL